MSQGQTGAEQRLVTPGMAVGPSAGKRAGSGIIAADDALIATQLGWLKEFNNTVSIDPINTAYICLLYTSPSPRDKRQSRMPSSA